MRHGGGRRPGRGPGGMGGPGRGPGGMGGPGRMGGGFGHRPPPPPPRRHRPYRGGCFTLALGVVGAVGAAIAILG